MLAARTRWLRGSPWLRRKAHLWPQGEVTDIRSHVGFWGVKRDGNGSHSTRHSCVPDASRRALSHCETEEDDQGALRTRHSVPLLSRCKMQHRAWHVRHH